MGGFLDALKHGIPGGERRTAYLQQQAEEEKQRHEQGEMAQHYLGLGAKVVGDGGVVKDHLPLTEGEVDEAGNYTPGTGVPEGMLRKAGADGRHVIKLKAPGSRDIQLELPTPEESAAYHLKLGHQLLTGGAPDRAIVNAEAVQQGGALARAKGQGEADGTFAAQQGERDRNGLSAPDWLSKIVKGADGRKYLPAELDALISNVGKSDELRTGLDSKKTMAAMQALSSVTDQAGYDEWRKANPEVAARSPQLYSPTLVKMMQRQAVPIEKQPEFDIKQKEADMAGETGAVDWNDQADKIVDPVEEPGRNAVLKARLRTAITRVEKNKILSDVADQEGKTDTAVKTVKAEGPYKIAAAVATAKAMNGTGAVANVPPHLQPTAIADYHKSGQALAGAQTAADDIQKVLDLAASGNKAAGANVPLVGVGALNAVNGIKRINSAEIHQYGTAGSLLDKIQGKLQGWTEGQPIPKDVLNDMKTLHQSLSEGAVTKHSREVDAINKSYGSKFEPMKFEPAQAAPVILPLPAKLSKADEGKVFLSPRTGKKLKVTAVNPDNPTQFKSEEVP